MKTYVTPLLSLLLVLAGGTVAQAQQSIGNPAITPWLNLYRGGASPVQNYNTLVHPEFDFRASIGQLQIQNAANEQGLSNLTSPAGPLVTGHYAGFMTQRSYFQTLGGGGGGATGSSFGTVGGSGSASPARR
jgi:hypothetical protein